MDYHQEINHPYSKELTNISLNGSVQDVKDMIEYAYENGHIFTGVQINHALSFSASYGNRDIVELLLEIGADDYEGAIFNAYVSAGRKLTTKEKEIQKGIILLLFLESLYNNKPISALTLRDIFHTDSTEKILKGISVKWPERYMIRKYADKIHFPKEYQKKRGMMPWNFFRYETLTTPMEELKQELISEKLGVRKRFENYNFWDPAIEDMIEDYTGFGKKRKRKRKNKQRRRSKKVSK